MTLNVIGSIFLYKKNKKIEEKKFNERFGYYIRPNNVECHMYKVSWNVL